MKTRLRLLALAGLGVASVLALMGCTSNTPTPTPAPTTSPGQTARPVVIISSPASNSTFSEGATVTLSSTSTSGSGVVLVELIVDGRLAQTSPTPNAQPQPQFSVLQSWQATPGQHTLTVRATDSQGHTGDASILLSVSGTTQPTTEVPTSAPPTVPPATAIPVTGQPVCTLNATFVADVTVPDNTSMVPGAPFVKTWAIQNAGTCDWGTGFSLVFVSGSRLGANSPAPIPFSPAGQTANISVNMIAPDQPGRYQSVWQLQASNGAVFGQRVDVVIVVPGGPTPVAPSPTPPAGGCTGTPQIASFTASPSTIQPGQAATLSWGLVRNATNVVLSTPQGNSGVATPGQITVQPNATTTYTLLAYCNNNAAQAQTTVTVPNVPPPTPPPSNPNQINSISVKRDRENYTVTVNYFWNGEDAPASMQVVGVNAQSDPATNRAQGKVLAGFVKNVTVTVSGPDVNRIDVCMVGRSGQELACGSQAVR